MDNKAKILIVENDPAQVVSYQDSIESFNRKSPIRIEQEIVESLEMALRAISEEPYDGAILDLRLSDGKAEGNEIIKAIVDIKRFPVIVYSGFIGDLDPDIPTSIFFQRFEKTYDFNEILRKLASIFHTGVTRILGRRGELEKLIDLIFWKHLSGSLEYWFLEKNEKTLLRHTLTHAIEYLEIDKDDNFINYNPAEVYIKPPIKPFLFTGTILKEKNGVAHLIVLSPACDLAHEGKAKSILLAEIESLKISLVNDHKEILKKPLPNNVSPDIYGKEYGKKENAKNILREIFKNNYAHRYHFLPSCNYFDGGLINFQCVHSLPSNKIHEIYEPISSVTTGYCKDIIARFSYYYSRQGSPDFDFEKLINSLIES